MKKLSLFLIVAASIAGGLKGQAFYEFNNRHLSQSHLWNPGFMPQYKATLSVGQTYIGTNLVGTTLNGLFGSSETPLQTVTRLIGEEDKQMGMDLYQQTDIFHFGFRSKKSYFSINSTLVNKAAIRVPKDLLGLAFLGNGAFIGNDADIDFSGNQIRSYLKNTFSYGRFLTNELSVGVNASLINGISDLNIGQARFGIGTDTGTASIYSLKLNGALNGRASLLGVDVEDALNDSAYDANQTVMDQLNQISMGTNQGYAFGFGAVYRLNEKFRFSLAVQNLGSIVWSLGAQEIKMNESEWIWNGLDTNQIDNFNDDIAQQIQDTFLNKFDIRGSKIESYTTQLKPRYTLGVEFLLMPRTHIQAFGGYGFGINGDKSFISTTLHQELGEWIDLRVGYSLYDVANPVHRLGLGLSLNLGPLQIFGSVNDILGIVNYGTSNVTSGMVGVNINIGRRKDRDYDEVPDKRDSCYKTFGVISNDGCPYGFLGGSMSYDQEALETTTEEIDIAAPSDEATEESQPVPTKKSPKKQIDSQIPDAEEAGETAIEVVSEEAEETAIDFPSEVEKEATATEPKKAAAAAKTVEKIIDAEEETTKVKTPSMEPPSTIAPSDTAIISPLDSAQISDLRDSSVSTTDSTIKESAPIKAPSKPAPTDKSKPKSKAIKNEDLEELMKR